MTRWGATFAGALDLRGHELAEEGFELIVCPSTPAEPRFLWGAGADMLRLLAEQTIDDSQLTADSAAVIHELEKMNLAAPTHSAEGATTTISRPWLLSVHHELVYALIAKVASQLEIEVLFIKGPALHVQGLRVREHSGDVDCWVRPGDDLLLAEAMRAWGWTPMYSPLTGTGVAHSLTLNPGGWGCAIDVHTRFPGMTIEPMRAFDRVRLSAEKWTFASREVDLPSTAVHAVIAALHDVRPIAGRPPSAVQRAGAQHALAAAGDDVVRAVEQLGATYVLRDLLQVTHPSVEIPPGEQPRDWAWRTTASGARRYAKAWMLVPWKQKPRVLLRLVWPQPGMAGAREHPTRPGAASVAARVRRLSAALVRFIRGL
ncbi:hypothetical protein [Microbacterium sp. LWH12-1.2]|uniref:hypothetical protein n=1 Tax=Microbacterium sp. LWH12-1.2 TaxID=3135259 RepID=UPI003442C1D3